MESKKLFLSFFLFKSRINKKGLSPIYLRVTIDGKRETIGTGISIEASNWDENKSLIIGDSAVVINQNHLLNSLKGRVMGIYTELLNAGADISTAAITKKLVSKDADEMTLLAAIKIHNASVFKKIGKDNTKATYTKYESLRVKLEHYIASEYKQKDQVLKELSQKFLVNFESFLKTKENIGHNTTIKYIQFLKRIIHFSIQQEWISSDPFASYRCRFKQVNRAVLSKAELSTIEAREFSTSRLATVRDIFIFSCYTGLAYADVKRLTLKEIITGFDNQLWIETFREKTKVRVAVPLLPKVLSLVQEYHEWRKEANSDKVLPVLSNQKMNAYLKEIADLCGIDKKLTFHIARHTFATTITLGNGVPIESVSKLLGHTNIKTTQQYAKVLDTKLSADMNSLRDKIF